MKKTKYANYVIGELPEGCKRCIIGKKTVLFITGKCSRKCVYCPLSELRWNTEQVYANEKPCKNFKDLIDEIKKSNSNSCSITGGDPLIDLNKTLNYAKKLKEHFGKKFHIHIYLSTTLVNERKIKKLAKFVDEIRFHPEFLSNPSKFDEDLRKISIAKKYYKLNNIGIEMPIFPNKKELMLEFIKQAVNDDDIGFVNLNELEIGDTNFSFIIKNYKLNLGGYTIKGSIKTGKWLLKQIEKLKLKVNVNICTAETKNWHQYQNRLKNYKKIKYSKKTKDGTIIYFAIKDFSKKDILKLNKVSYLDKQKNQIILNPRHVRQLTLTNKHKIYRIEEYPTFDREEIQVERLN